jgi:hypothetical protein
VFDWRIAWIAARIGEGAVLDRIDPGTRRRLDAARAMGMGGDAQDRANGRW